MAERELGRDVRKASRVVGKEARIVAKEVGKDARLVEREIERDIVAVEREVEKDLAFESRAFKDEVRAIEDKLVSFGPRFTFLKQDGKTGMQTDENFDKRAMKRATNKVNQVEKAVRGQVDRRRRRRRRRRSGEFFAIAFFARRRRGRRTRWVPHGDSVQRRAR